MEAGETYLAIGRRADATALGSRLQRRLGIQGETFAAVLHAEIALADGRARDAQASLLEARKKADAWLVRYWLGRSYLAMGAFAEADSEFDACLRRRGEALAVFLDDFPYLPSPRGRVLLPGPRASRARRAREQSTRSGPSSPSKTVATRPVVSSPTHHADSPAPTSAERRSNASPLRYGTTTAGANSEVLPAESVAVAVTN